MNKTGYILIGIVAAVIAIVAITVVVSDDTRAFVDDDRLGETAYVRVETITSDGTIDERYYHDYVWRVDSDSISVSRGNLSFGTSYSLSTGLLTRYTDSITGSLGTENIETPLFGIVESEKYTVNARTMGSYHEEFIWVYNGMVLQWTENSKQSTYSIVSTTCFDDDITIYDATVRDHIVPGDFIGYTYNIIDDSSGVTHGEHKSTALVVLSVDDQDTITARWTHTGQTVKLTLDEFLLAGITPVGNPEEVVQKCSDYGIRHLIKYENCNVWVGGIATSINMDGEWYSYSHSSFVNGNRVLNPDATEENTYNVASYFVMIDDDTNLNIDGLFLSTYYKDIVSVKSINYVRETNDFYDRIDRTFETSYQGTILEGILVDNYPESMNYETINTPFGEMNCNIVETNAYGLPATLWISTDMPGLVMKATLYDDRTIDIYLSYCSVIEDYYTERN